MFYDNPISKLIVWAPTRAEAIERMSRALSGRQIGGIKTNLGFHRRVMQEPDFRADRYNTGYIEAHKQTLAPAQPLDDRTRCGPRRLPQRFAASSSSTASAVKHETAKYRNLGVASRFGLRTVCETASNDRAATSSACRRTFLPPVSAAGAGVGATAGVEAGAAATGVDGAVVGATGAGAATGAGTGAALAGLVDRTVALRRHLRAL
ncbi:MAG: hypothetical protein U0787_19080 [Polyangia bacterium]